MDRTLLSLGFQKVIKMNEVFMAKLREFLHEIQQYDLEIKKLQAKRGTTYANAATHIRADPAFSDELQYQNQIFQMPDGQYYEIQWLEGSAIRIEPFTENIHESK